jgi:trans-aconitate methyltransferase
VLYLGIGAGRLAAPLHRAGIELVGVDAHPGMLAHARERIPGIELHQALIGELRLRRRFDLVIGPSSILTDDANLAVAARHLRPGGRVAMELMNPHWLATSRHDGVRVSGRVMEVDYQLPDGSVVTQVVDEVDSTTVAPEATDARLARHGLRLEWMGGAPDHDLDESPTYFVLASK